MKLVSAYVHAILLFYIAEALTRYTFRLANVIVGEYKLSKGRNWI